MKPVLLSGGSGTRLWPLSRMSFPKQFCKIWDKSLLEESLERLTPFGTPIVLTVQSMKELTEKLYKEMGLPSEDHILYEPMGRNTAPALGWLCYWLSLKGEQDTVVGVFPADHLIEKREEFSKALKLAEKHAEKGVVVTLGLRPTFAATGYGYIELAEAGQVEVGELQACSVVGFREKPNEATAHEFLKSGKHFWNAGIFVFKVSSMIENFQKYLPEMWNQISSIREDLSNLKTVYESLNSISIDYGVMEKLEHQLCIPCDIGWSDVGSWDEIQKVTQQGKVGNLQSRAKVIEDEGGQGNFVMSSEAKVIGLLGVKNLRVINTQDALLISKEGQSEGVKELVQLMKKKDWPEAMEHPFDVRPWGDYRVLEDGSQFKAKVVTVNPMCQLSYQSHEKREEHWVVVSGEGVVLLDGDRIQVKTGSYVRINQGSKHRMSNTGKTPLKFVEVQLGDYFGEDDIVRYEDDYGRS